MLNIDRKHRFEFHGEVVGKDCDFLDELFDQSLIKFCDISFLTGDEVLKLLDLVHAFLPVMAAVYSKESCLNKTPTFGGYIICEPFFFVPEGYYKLQYVY